MENKRDLLKKFIEYYYLDGMIDNIIIRKDEDKDINYVKSINDRKSLIVFNKLRKNIISNDIGIYNSKKLIDILKLYNDSEDFNIDITERTIQMNDERGLKSDFILADKEVIDDGLKLVNKVLNVDEWNFSFQLSKKDIKLIRKSIKALNNADNLFVDNNKIIMADGLNNKDKIEFEIDAEENLNGDDIPSFDLNNFNTVISKIKDDIILSVSQKFKRPFLRIEYDNDDFHCEYYLMYKSH